MDPAFLLCSLICLLTVVLKEASYCVHLILPAALTQTVPTRQLTFLSQLALDLSHISSAWRYLP